VLLAYVTWLVVEDTNCGEGGLGGGGYKTKYGGGRLFWPPFLISIINKTLRGVSTTIYCNMEEGKDNGVTATRLCPRNSIRLIGSVVKEGDW